MICIELILFLTYRIQGLKRESCVFLFPSHSKALAYLKSCTYHVDRVGWMFPFFYYHVPLLSVYFLL